MATRVPWGHILAEATLIITGVLVGLGIDAWWDQRQATQAAREELSSVLGELEDARAEIDRGLQQHRRWASTASALHSRLLAVEPGGVVTVRDTLLSGLVLPIWTTDAPSALLESFATSAHIGQIDAPELSRHLLRWVPLLRDLRDDEARVRTFQDTQVRPYISKTVDLGAQWLALVTWMRGGRRDVPGLMLPDYDSVEHEIVLESTVELRNLVAQIRSLLVGPLLQSPQALEVLQELSELIQAELL